MQDHVFVIARSFFATGFGGVLEVRERVRIIRDLGYEVTVVHGHPMPVPEVLEHIGERVSYLSLYSFFDQSISRHMSLRRTLAHWKERQLLWDRISLARPTAIMIHGERPLRLYLALQGLCKTFYFRHDSAAASNGSFLTQMNDIWFKNETYLRKIILILRRMCEARRFPKFNYFVANSRYIAKIHNVPKALIQLPPLIPTQHSAVTDYSQQRDRRKIVFAGRLEYAKGAKDALEVINRLPDIYSMEFFGDGEFCEALMQESSASSAAGRVRFHGQSPAGEVRRAMALAGVTLIPSLVDEAMPLTAIESLACGTPVIGYAVGGLPELIDEQVGITVPRADIDALVSAVSRLCDDESTWSRRSSAAVEKSKQFFGPGQFREVIAEMIKSKKSAFK